MSEKDWEVKISYHSCPYHSNKKGFITRYICFHTKNKSDKCTAIYCPVKCGI